MSFDYDAWIKQQAENMARELPEFYKAGFYDVSIFFTPAHGDKAGFLTAGVETPQGATDVLRFLGGVGSRVSLIPAELLYDRLWHACRRLNMIPTTI